MAKEFPTFEEALSFIRDVQVKLLADNERSEQFQELMTAFMKGTFPAQLVLPYVKILLGDEPDLVQEFQKFCPRKLEQNHVDKRIQENGFQEFEISVEEKGSGDDTIQEFQKEKNQEIDIDESEVVQEVETHESEVVAEKKVSRKGDIQACLVYVNRVLKGLKHEPHLIPKFFDLMAEYRSDLNQEKLERGLFALFRFHPEFGFEFTQLITEVPSSGLEKPRYFSSKKDVSTNPLEVLQNRFEDETFEIEMTISRINSAIDNTMKFLLECRNKRRTMEVTRYLTGENVRVILKYCKENLKNCRHPQECAYSVVGKLKVQLEVEKEKRLNIGRNMASESMKLQHKMASEIQKLPHKKRRIS